jgi:ketosteroid isomerase-like protein
MSHAADRREPQTYLWYRSGESGGRRSAILLSAGRKNSTFLYNGGAAVNRSLAILAVGSLVTACTVSVNANDSPTGATEGSLMQADRDFAVATHARGIDGWMSFYAPDAIRIRYRGNMVKGAEEIRNFDLPGISDTTTILNWEPTDAHVFHGGDIGSTTGRYWIVNRTGPDAGKEGGHGRYVTMWRRDHDHWLVIMDTGYPDPAIAR